MLNLHLLFTLIFYIYFMLFRYYFKHKTEHLFPITCVQNIFWSDQSELIVLLLIPMEIITWNFVDFGYCRLV